MAGINRGRYSADVGADGKVHDLRRIDYLKRHLNALLDSIDKGAKVAGYFQWSLLDNFEWSFGYSKRFGLVHVDYQTQKRTMKESGHWYRQVVSANGL